MNAAFNTPGYPAQVMKLQEFNATRTICQAHYKTFTLTVAKIKGLGNNSRKRLKIIGVGIFGDQSEFPGEYELRPMYSILTFVKAIGKLV